ncbi:Ig-like domain repeat protein [Streptomyces sp. SID13666]|uniref:Ig-like domain-containing protein n=1 Tax=unclassified Streptomyces TaxID=2593676 RepID=UPI0013C005AF|nr:MULTISPECIES: Ig-like domain-containing protein [unclassified Streptomyces]NEA58351.1 Ig-like domain repeat protein [Streptomyces sp. SID13666]NEA72914.1 Ig-like domain repeat protein [Streptomyces sp. SID13588]
MIVIAPRKVPAVLFALAAVLLAAAAALFGAAAPAHAGAAASGSAASAGTFAPTPAGGDLTADPFLTSLRTSAGCPAGFGASAALQFVMPDGSAVTIPGARESGGFDTGPFTLTYDAIGGTLADVIGAPVADGDHELRVTCWNGTGDAAPAAFSTTITSTGDTWTVKSQAVPTATTLTASPAGTAAAGAEVTLTGAVDPAGAVGKLAFFDGATALGEADVVSGQATVKTSALVAGAHDLTARFTPADPAAFVASTSAVVTYTITAATQSPSPTDTGSPTPTGSPTASETGSPTATETPTATTSDPTSGGTSGDGGAGGGSGGAGSSGGGSTGGNGSLAHTGAGVGLPLGVAAGVLAVAGVVFVRHARRSGLLTFGAPRHR